ncbi:MAG: UbiA family prenyltransferase [Dehalococcoidia bacterium]
MQATRRLFPVEAPRLLRAARVIHPFPVALNVIATAGLAAIANEGLPEPAVLTRLCAAMFCVQAAIGALNDYCDRELDALTKPWKPIVAGAIEPRSALVVAACSALVAGALTATFGPLSFVVGAAGLAAGVAYDVRLKRSVLSALPFMVALAALPFWVWVSLDRFVDQLWWLLAFAPLVGLSVHLANTAPDLESDRVAGVRGLAHVIGLQATVIVCWTSFALVLVGATALGLHLRYDWAQFLVGALPAAGLLSLAIAAYYIRPGQAALQLGFGAIGVATASLAVGWLAAVG